MNATITFPDGSTAQLVNEQARGLPADFGCISLFEHLRDPADPVEDGENTAIMIWVRLNGIDLCPQNQAVNDRLKTLAPDQMVDFRWDT